MLQLTNKDLRAIQGRINVGAALAKRAAKWRRDGKPRPQHKRDDREKLFADLCQLRTLVALSLGAYNAMIAAEMEDTLPRNFMQLREIHQQRLWAIYAACEQPKEAK